MQPKSTNLIIVPKPNKKRGSEKNRIKHPKGKIQTIKNIP